MILSEKLLNYLKGEKFSTAENFTYPTKIYPETREEYLKKAVKGKKVVHIGCIDHLPVLDTKIKTGHWLHNILTENAEKCVGFDINKEGIEKLRSNYGIDNVFYQDVAESASDIILKEKWDYLILGEVLEHIDNPVDFLSKLKTNYSSVAKQIIITVPHIITRNAFKNIKKGIECINTDHRYWFTPFTIMKVAAMSGLVPRNIEFKNRVVLSFPELVYRKLYKTVLRTEPSYPIYYFNTLVLISDM